MKVIKTCLSQSWGGMEMYALDTVKQLRKRNIETELWCSFNSPLHKEAEKNEIPLQAFNFTSYFHPSQILRASKLLRAQAPDIIHCGASKDLWLMVPALKIRSLSTPLLLSKHMGSYIVKKDFLHRIIYNRVNYGLAISKVIEKNLIDTTPLTQNRVLLLHNSIDTRRFDPSAISRDMVRKELKISNNDLLIGMLARFSPGKGHEEFLLSAQKLLSLHNNLIFMIVGEPSKNEDDYGTQIKTMAASLGISDKVIFTGFRSDTPEILAAIDIFVFPSHAEAFGIALAEALSMGKPSVCSNSDGVLDIAVDGETSLLFEKQNWNDLAAKINILITNKDMREAFSAAARIRAVQYFDIEVFTDKLISYYQKAIDERNSKIKGT